MAGHKEERIVPGSFRDPSGFLFWKEGALYRQINQVYKDDYELLIGSGLYKDLADSGLLIPHSEAGIEGYVPERSYKIIAPKKVPFISYPYEWCFSQLKDAALATLEIQKRASKDRRSFIVRRVFVLGISNKSSSHNLLCFSG